MIAFSLSAGHLTRLAAGRPPRGSGAGSLMPVRPGVRKRITSLCLRPFSASDLSKSGVQDAPDLNHSAFAQSMLANSGCSRRRPAAPARRSPGRAWSAEGKGKRGAEQQVIFPADVQQLGTMEILEPVCGLEFVCFAAATAMSGLLRRCGSGIRGAVRKLAASIPDALDFFG